MLVPLLPEDLRFSLRSLRHFKRRSPPATDEGQGVKGVNTRNRLTSKRPAIPKALPRYATVHRLMRCLLSSRARPTRRGPPSTPGLLFGRKRRVSETAVG